MKLFPDRLHDHLHQRLLPIYLVAGPEPLLVEESCDAIRAAARAAGVVERQVLEADSRFEWSRLSSAGENLSLFASRRLLEVRLPSGLPGREGGAALRAWAEGSSDDVLLIKAANWDWKSEKSVWFRALDRAGAFVPCWAVKAHQLPQWIRGRLAAEGLRVSDQACQFLAARLEGNLLAAAQQVKRLALLYGQNRTLDIEELSDAVADHARFEPFRLIELVLSGQPGAALRCLRGLRETDQPKPLIVYALSRDLWLVKAFASLRQGMSAQAAFSRLKVWPSKEAGVSAAAGRIAMAGLDRALAGLADLDVLAKSAEHKRFWLELERLCVNLAAGPEMAR